ncbi:hypothetical protein BDN70DRAFT_558325 [Pholiota conissans]|uniref:Uncharacterized protein n=1 Tax=Pholiota conissans TaxID=109636 RepID=A0A9P5Z4W4_9AGAR|nr:hypothetical protein BDN70DRAFT_558325 [Pholiota conissans]
MDSNRVSKFTLPTTFNEGCINPDSVDDFSMTCQFANDTFKDFLKAYEPYQWRPSPSSYAKEWAEPQESFGGLLCKRSNKRTGLPLITLHDIFKQFQERSAQPLPDYANDALRVAFTLCSEMGDSFANKKERSARFNDCVSDLFCGWDPQTTVQSKSEYASGEVDFTLKGHRGKDAICNLAIREDKLELGDDGDPYLQASRDYQLLIHSYEDKKNNFLHTFNFLAIGAPMFIICDQCLRLLALSTMRMIVSLSR